MRQGHCRGNGRPLATSAQLLALDLEGGAQLQGKLRSESPWGREALQALPKDGEPLFLLLGEELTGEAQESAPDPEPEAEPEP